MATKSEEFVYFQLGPKRVNWFTDDGKIKLSAIPNEEGKTTPYGRVSLNDKRNSRLVQIAVDRGQLEIMESPPQNLVKNADAMVDLSSKREKEIQLTTAAATLLKLNDDSLMSAIGSVVDKSLLKTAIMLESKGQNKIKKKRDHILVTLKKRLESLGAFAEYSEAGEQLKADFDPSTAVGRGSVEE